MNYKTIRIETVSRFNRKHCSTRILNILMICCSLFFSAAPQSAPTDVVQALGEKQVAPEPTAIPVGKITREAESVEDWLGSISAEIQSEKENQQTPKELSEINDEIEVGQQRFDSALTRRLTPDGLKSHRMAWQATSDRINGRVRDLEEQIELFERNLRQTAEKSKVWQLTLASAKKESAPRAIIERASSLVSALNKQTGLLKKARNRILDYQNQAAGLQKSIDEVLTRITLEQKKIETEIFARQDPPLWRLSLADRPQLEEQLESAMSVFSDLKEETIDFMDINMDSLINYGLLIALMGWFLSRRREILTRKYSLVASPDRQPHAALSVLRHPWSAAILLGALFSSFVFRGEVVGFKLLKGIIGVPLWLRVVRGTLPAILLGPLVLVALIAMIDIARTGLGGFGMINRVMLTLVYLLALVASFWLQRMRWRQHVRQTRIGVFWFGVVSTWVSLSQLTVFAGLAAVLAGYTLFADRLVSLAIWGSILGSAFLVMTQLFESVIQSMVDEHLFDRVRMIKRNSSLFMNVVRVLIRGVGFCAWFFLVFRGMRIWEPFVAWAGHLLNADIGRPPVTFSIGDLLAFGMTLWISWVLARFLTFALDQEVFSRVRLGAGIPFAITTFTRYTILVAGFVAALGILGFPLDKITLLLSALGVGIGFGLQNITNNFISGIILLFERPIRVGDKVQLDDLVGTVASIGIRASKIRGFDGADVIVPNGDFISTRVTNWTLADQQRRIILPVHVAYGTDPRRVLEILDQVAVDNEEVLHSPSPEALFRGFGPDALNFELRAWTESERGWLVVMSDLALSTSEALKNAGIVIPLPQRELTLNKQLLAQTPEIASHLQPSRPT